MPSPRRFTTEFTERLKAGYLGEEFATSKIATAISQYPDLGQLSRIFDNMPISPDTMAEAYSDIDAAADSGKLEAHMREIAMELAPELLNEDMTDLNDDTIARIGEENYKKLCPPGQPKQQMVDKLLQAIVVSYGQVITKQFETTIGPEFDASRTAEQVNQRIDKKQAFNRKITLPMEQCIVNITRDHLLSTHIKAKLEDPNAVKDKLRLLMNTIDEARSQLEELNKNCENPMNIEHIQLAIKGMKYEYDKLDEAAMKLEITPNEANLTGAIDRINLTTETLTAITKNHLLIPTQEPHIKSFGEKFLNVLARIFTFGQKGYKSEETQRAETTQSNIDNTVNSMNSMKEALHTIKSTDPASSAPIEKVKEAEPPDAMGPS